MPIAFSDAWARAWCVALNESDTYRAVAANWEGSVALAAVGTDQHPVGAVYLDLWHGACRDARPATGADLEAADFVINAEPSAWQDLLGGRLSPMSALLTGRLRLVRGELTKLLPHATAAQELLRLAERIETTFPSGW